MVTDLDEKVDNYKRYDFPLAETIRKTSDGLEKLLASGLNRDAIIVLLHDQTGIGKRDVKRLLDALTVMADKYTRKNDED